MAVEKRLIGVQEAAGYLGIRTSTLYSWAERRKVPSVKMGARLLFDLKDLDQLIETAKRPVASRLRTARRAEESSAEKAR